MLEGAALCCALLKSPKSQRDSEISEGAGANRCRFECLNIKPRHRRMPLNSLWMFSIKQRSQVMMAAILSAIYRHFLKAALLGMVATRGVRR
jgi:hypothetical protein